MKVFQLFWWILPLSLLFTACSSDDDDENLPLDTHAVTAVSAAYAETSINQDKKTIDVVFGKEVDLSKVKLTVELAKGASLKSPKDLIFNFLEKKSQDLIVTYLGKDITYKVSASIVHALTGVEYAKVGDVKAEVLFDQATSKINLTFLEEVDLTKVEFKLNLAEGASLLVPNKNPGVMDVSKGATIKVKTAGDNEVTYAVTASLLQPIKKVEYAKVGKSEGEVTLDPAQKRISILFKEEVDLKKVELKLVLEDKVEVKSNPIVIDLTKESTLNLTLGKAAVAYKVVAKIEVPEEEAPKGWEIAKDYATPAHTKLYKTTKFGGAEKVLAYIAKVDASKAKFNIFADKAKKTVPKFYEENKEKYFAVLNGTTSAFVYKDGEKVNGSPSTLALGVTADGKILYGQAAEEGGKLVIDGKEATAGFGLQTLLVKEGKPVDGLGDKPAARSAVGMDKDGNVYLLVVSAFAEESSGVSEQGLADVLVKEFNCVNAAITEGGSGSCFHVDGKPTITSTKGVNNFKDTFSAFAIAK